MSRIIVFLFLIVSLGVKAQESEKYYWEGFKYQSKLKLEKATNAYLKAIKASENKSNINSRELYYLTFAHTEIAKIYSGASIFSNNSDNISAAYNSVKKIFEYYAILYQRNEESYIKDFERAKVLSIANESLKNILSLKPDLFPSNDKINNDTNSTLGIVITWKNNYLAIIEKYNSPNKSSEETYLKENDIILEITTANGINYYSIEDFIIANKNLGEGSDGDVFRVKLVRNGQIEYTQIKKYRKASTKDVTPPQSAELVNNKENQVVSLTVSGTGKTKEDAQKNALRSAIEQAFGAFVSSKTEILNDSIVKDEVVSITNGNVQKYDVISEGVLQNGSYVSTVNAVISITKLTSFAESKGAQAEFKGSSFAMNIKLEKLNEQNEIIAIRNLISISEAILSNSLDYSLEIKDPVLLNSKNELYQLDLIVKAKTNPNFQIFLDNFWSIIKSISMSQNEKVSYENLKKSFFEIQAINRIIGETTRDYTTMFNLDYGKSYYLRNKESLVALYDFLKHSNRWLFNIKIHGEKEPIILNSFFSPNHSYNDYYEDSIINRFSTLLFYSINPNASGEEYNWINDYIQSYPNAYAFSNQFEQNPQMRYDFSEEYIKDISCLSEVFIDEYRIFGTFGKFPQTKFIEYRKNHDSKLKNQMIEKTSEFKLLLTTENAPFEYQYIIRRLLKIGDIEKITEYKIIKN